MSLYRTHFERLFKRRNPKTLQKMAETAELQLTRRVIKPNIVEFLPLIKCFVYKLQEVKREAGKKFITALSKEDTRRFDLPEVSFEECGDDVGRPRSRRSRSYTWSNSGRLDTDVIPYKPRRIVYCSIDQASRTPIERKSIDPNRNAISRVKRRRNRSVPGCFTSTIELSDTTREAGSPVPTNTSVESWYGNKSFLPGLRNKAITMLNQGSGSGYNTETSTPAHQTNTHSQQTTNRKLSDTYAATALQRSDTRSFEAPVPIRCGANMVKPIPRVTATYTQ